MYNEKQLKRTLKDVAMKPIRSGIINIKTGQFVALSDKGGSIGLDLKARELNKDTSDMDFHVFTFSMSHSLFTFNKIIEKISDKYPEQAKMLHIYKNRFYVAEALERLNEAKEALRFAKKTLIEMSGDDPKSKYLAELIEQDIEKRKYAVDCAQDRLDLVNRDAKSLKEPQYSVIAIYEHGVEFDGFGVTKSEPMVRKVVDFMPNEDDLEKEAETILVELSEEKGCSLEALKRQTSVETWEI